MTFKETGLINLNFLIFKQKCFELNNNLDQDLKEYDFK